GGMISVRSPRGSTRRCGSCRECSTRSTRGNYYGFSGAWIREVKTGSSIVSLTESTLRAAKSHTLEYPPWMSLTMISCGGTTNECLGGENWLFSTEATTKAY